MTAHPGRPEPRRGRPRKFAAPARPVTITLPEPVLEALAGFDADLARAIVRLAQPLVGHRPHPPAELATFGKRSVIVVDPSRTLERRTGVNLVHLPDGRALISFDQATTIASLELMIADAVDDRDLHAHDREIFEAIRDILRDARRSNSVTIEPRNIIVIETRRTAARRRRTRSHS